MTGRQKKEDSKTLECDNVNVTELLVVCFVGNSLYIDVFCSSTKIYF